MRRAFLVYFEFGRVAFLKILAYRLRYFTGIITYFINVTVYYFIWKAIYSRSVDLAGYDLAQMVTYSAVGWILRSFYFNNVDRDIAAEVVEGRIANNLIKPVNSQLMYLAQSVGESCFRFLMFSIPIAVLLVAVYPIEPPASLGAAALFGVSCAGSVLLFAVLNFFVGCFALQLQSILGIIRAKYFIIEFLSGLLLPISFFPEALQRMLLFAPFQHISYTPLQIYLGKLSGFAAWEAVGIQFFWIALLYLAGAVHWSGSIRRLAVQGG